MLDKDRIELGGQTYEVKQHGALRSDRILAQLMQIVAPGLQALEAKDKEGVDKILDAVFQVSTKSDREQIMWLRDEMLDCISWVQEATGRNGATTPVLQPMSKLYDQHFKGRTVDRLKLLSFALKVNFSDFLDESVIGSLLAAAAPRAARSNSQPEPDGSSSV